MHQIVFLWERGVEMEKKDKKMLDHLLEYYSVMESQYRKELDEEKILLIQKRYRELRELAELYEGTVDVFIEEKTLQVQMTLWCPAFVFADEISRKKRRSFADIINKGAVVHLTAEHDGISLEISESLIKKVMIQDRSKELSALRKQMKQMIYKNRE